MKISRYATRRFFTALLLTGIYFMMTLSPLAPLALRSPELAHAITGECAGDCNICGCSAEQRANHTCCCAQKKKLESHQKSQPDCCKPKAAGGPTVLKCGCPCGSGKQLTLGATTSELIPFFFAVPIAHGSPAHDLPTRPRPLFSRTLEPPEPPPRLFLSC